MENAFYNKENLKPEMRSSGANNMQLAVPEGVDEELLRKVLSNPEMATILMSLAKSLKIE